MTLYKAIGVSPAGRRFSLRDLGTDTAKTDTPPAFVVLTTEEHRALLDRMEDAEDAALARELEAKANPDDNLSLADVERLYAGEHPLRVWRDVRGLTLAQLGRQAGIVPSYISAIERGKKPGSVDAMQKLAKVLRVTIDDLVVEPSGASDRVAGDDIPRT